MKYRNKNFILGTLALFIAVFMCVSSFTLSVHAVNFGSLGVFYSDTNKIGTWSSVPSAVYVKNLTTNLGSSFPLNNMVSHATSQWNSALGFSLTPVPNTTGAFTIYGGTAYDIAAIGLGWTSNEDNAPAGSTICTEASNGLYTYNSRNITHYSISRARIALYYDVTRTSSEYYKAATHEIGHALGWRGHSATYTDVMYYSENSYFSLTNQDISHLFQVYH